MARNSGYDFPTIHSLARHFLDLQERPVLDQKEACNEPIAILGAACRMPGGACLADWWSFLEKGGDGVRDLPSNRVADSGNMTQAGYLEDVAGFDSDFFGIAPREATSMDPQQRLLLEVAWESLEAAHLDAMQLRGSRTGVFVGISHSDYAQLAPNPGEDAYLGTGVAGSIAANRISYLFDFRGPSLAIDTACSSSLVAIHQACESLRRGECDQALAAGVNLILKPDLTQVFTKAGMMSPEFRCKTFDAEADGYVRGEGCGVIVLKPLSQALAENAPIWGVIRGSAINQDGRSNGLTAPNGPSQQAVIRQALAHAGVQPQQISYIEAHGTGTPLGDPMEIQSLEAVLGAGVEPSHPCHVGSVKTNIGHLEAAAGMAGLLKVLLCLKHDTLPAHLHFKKLNPHLSLQNSRLRIPTQSVAWPKTEGGRYAGISSFGFGGTNAHLIVTDPPAASPKPAESSDRPVHLFTLSANSQPAGMALVERYRHLLDHSPAAMGDLCFSANTGRSHLPYRLALTAVDREDLKEQLGKVREDHWQRASGQPKLAFLFSGQGSQYVGMALSLYQSQPHFKATLDRCDQFLRPHLEKSLLEVLFSQDENAANIDQTQYTQPAIFAVACALVDLLKRWGIYPDLVLGHSLGEYVAAWCAGVFSMEDGLLLVTRRAQLMQQLVAPGKMVSVFASEDVVTRLLQSLDEPLAIAALNGPRQTVVSGSFEAMELLERHLLKQDIRFKALTTSHAFHSAMMDPILEPFRAVLQKTKLNRPSLPICSNLTGQFENALLTTPDYWVRHLREPVRFQDCLERVGSQEIAAMLEIGAKPVLLGLASHLIDSKQTQLLPCLRPNRDTQLYETLATLYQLGASVNWRAFDSTFQRQPVALPHYPWQRKRYWFQKGPSSQSWHSYGASIPLLGTRLPAMADLPSCRTWEQVVGPHSDSSLWEARLFGARLWPWSRFAAMAENAVTALAESTCWSMETVTFQHPLILAGEEERIVQTSLEQKTDRCFHFRVQSRNAEATTWTTHVHAILKKETEPKDPSQPLPQSLALGLMFYASDEHRSTKATYDLISHCAVFGDHEGFEGVWVAEEHFNPRGSLTPNAAILHASLARTTQRIRLRAGSVVLPLHHSLRVAEEWAMVDQLSQGRVELAISAGCDAEEYVLNPDGFEQRHQVMLNEIPALQALWSGESRTLRGGSNKTFEVQIAPKPVQPQLPLWITTGAHTDTFEKAGALGAHVLTHLLDQDLGELERKIHAYRLARQQAGLDPASGRVAVILPTFIDEDLDSARQVAKKPYAQFLASQPRLLQGLLQAQGHVMDLACMGVSEIQAQAEAYFENHASSLGLIGSVDSCSSMLKALAAKGVTEIACLLDFGLTHDQIRMCLPRLAQLHARLKKRLAVDKRLGMEGRIAIPAIQRVCNDTWQGDAFYTRLDQLGLSVGNPQIHVEKLYLGRTEVLLKLAPTAQQIAREMGLAAFQEYAFQAALAFALAQPSTSELAMPSAFEHFKVRNPIGQPAWCYAAQGMRHPESDESSLPALDLLILAEDGTLLAEMAGLKLRPVPKDLVRVPAANQNLYQVQWLEQPLSSEQLQPWDSPGSWLVLMDQGGTAEQMCRQLEALGENVIRLHKGPDFQIKERGRFQIQPGNPEAMRRLWENLRMEYPLRGCLCTWFLDTPENHLLNADLLDQVADTHLMGLINWVRQLSTFGTPVPIYMYTQGAQRVSDQDQPSLAPALLWGWARSFSLEYPEYWGGLVDLDPKLDPTAQATFAIRPLRLGPGEDQLAQRGTQLFSARLVAQPHQPTRPLTIQSEGAYLVTGGLGQLGMLLAQWLVTRGARRLYLTGRSKPAGETLQQIQTLRNQGCHVEVVQADVGCDSDLTSLAKTLREEGIQLHGLIHAAGVVNLTPIAELESEALLQMLRPKVRGTWLLHQHFQPRGFFLNLSSISAVWGTKHLAHYGAANHFLDQFAEFGQANGWPIFAINLGPIAEIGMATSSDHFAQTLTQTGLHLIPPEEALVMIERVLTGTVASQVATLMDWPRFKSVYAMLGARRFFDEIQVADTRSAHPLRGIFRQHLAQLPKAMRLGRFIHHLQQHVAQVLELQEPPCPNQGLYDMGMDSLMALEVKNRLELDLDVELSPTLIFNYSTISRIAEHLLTEILSFDGQETLPDEEAGYPDQDTDQAIQEAISQIEDAEVLAMIQEEFNLLQEGLTP